MRNKKPLIRSLAAASFLGLFLFICADKLLHTHLAAEPINIEETHLSTTSACALCDFQPGKDAELFKQATVSVPINHLPVQPLRPAAILHDLYCAIHGDRGPPFLV